MSGVPARDRVLWREAASFSARKHAGQLRRDGRTPYFAHVVRVSMTVSELFGCHDEVTGPNSSSSTNRPTASTHQRDSA